MKRNMGRTEGKGNRILKGTAVFAIAVGTFMTGGFYCHAAGLAENAGNWLLEQLFWIGLIVLAVSLLGCLLKKNYVGAGITFVVGGIILYFVYNPRVIYNIGEKLGQIFTNGI